MHSAVVAVITLILLPSSCAVKHLSCSLSLSLHLSLSLSLAVKCSVDFHLAFPIFHFHFHFHFPHCPREGIHFWENICSLFTYQFHCLSALCSAFNCRRHPTNHNLNPLFDFSIKKQLLHMYVTDSPPIFLLLLFYFVIVILSHWAFVIYLFVLPDLCAFDSHWFMPGELFSLISEFPSKGGGLGCWGFIGTFIKQMERQWEHLKYASKAFALRPNSHTCSGWGYPKGFRSRIHVRWTHLIHMISQHIRINHGDSFQGHKRNIANYPGYN